MSSSDGYVPERGDAVWITSNSQANGKEGIRFPAFVISTSAYNSKIGLALLCPITDKVKGYPFEVRIPDRMSVAGAVLSDEIRSTDWRALNAELICRLPEATVSEVLRKASVLLAK